MQQQAERILTFWVDEVGPDGWYKQDDSLDQRIADEFGNLWRGAAEGEFDHWSVDPRGALALIILLDQFPRNMFRGAGRAFASDEHALAIAKDAIRKGHDMAVPEPERRMFYMPLMHSECLTDQERCIRLIMLNLPETGASALEHAKKHREVIRRFGRYPSRNGPLGRTDSKAEIAYREEGGYMS